MWFELQDYAGTTIATWGDESHAGDEGLEVVLEERKYGLVVHDADPEDVYSLKVGDEELGIEQKRYQPTVCNFLQDVYFESANGRSTLSIGICLKDGSLRELSTREFYVLPSKIGRENYSRMVADLQAVCRSLVNDLVGKSRHSMQWKNRLRSRVCRSREEDFRSVEKTWHDLLPLLDEIESSPARIVGGRPVLMACDRNRSMRNLRVMMKRGIDPRSPVAGRKCRLMRVALSEDTQEHRMIKGFLSVLSARLQKCREGLAGEISAIKGDKPFRFRRNSDGTPSLYETEDLPRLEKLGNYAKLVSRLQQEIAARMASDFWSGIGKSSDLPGIGQFGENKYYIHVAGIILAYLRNGFNYLPETGDDFTTKKTSRLYEQWLIVQIVSAFEACGLEIDTWDSVVQKSIDRQFGFDFKRNTCFSSRLSDDYEVCVRYEPWILPRDMITDHQEETLCHGGHADSFLSPDCVIELRQHVLGQQQTVYAVVLDAKYSRSPSPRMRESVSKYRRIRSSVGGCGVQVARQTWVVFIGPDNQNPGIYIDDEALTFLATEGPVDAESFESSGEYELIHGDIIVRPTTDMRGGTSTDTRGVALNEVVLDFIKGTLSYFRKIVVERRG